jgi:hypothetical protein
MNLALLLAVAALQAPLAENTGGGIAWYGTWEGGVAEARASARPILLMSAAPRCHDVPGMW